MLLNQCSGSEVLILWFLRVSLIDARGLLLLYRPRDISNDCVFSHHLRYDLSFGNGMSDTITLVFRTMSELDYECLVEIVTENVPLLVVIRFPNPIGVNCAMNGDAFTVLKKNRCLRICELIGERDTISPYFIISANLYQVTATSARKKPLNGCNLKNESICVISEDEYCFTSGVVCDGINNCGVADWFDERKSDCELPVERIGFAPVIAVVAVIACVALAGGHLMMRWLPPLANSFFIFNANEDNRLCIDPVFIAPDIGPCDIEKSKRISIIPVSSSSSEDQSNVTEHSERGIEMQNLVKTEAIPEDGAGPRDTLDLNTAQRRKNTMRAMTELLQQLRSITSRRVSKTTKADHATAGVM